jgi:hypothetical protein
MRDQCEVRRTSDGSIDIAFYAAWARRLRAQANAELRSLRAWRPSSSDGAEQVHHYTNTPLKRRQRDEQMTWRSRENCPGEAISMACVYKPPHWHALSLKAFWERLQTRRCRWIRWGSISREDAVVGRTSVSTVPSTRASSCRARFHRHRRGWPRPRGFSQHPISSAPADR